MKIDVIGNSKITKCCWCRRSSHAVVANEQKYTKIFTNIYKTFLQSSNYKLEKVLDVRVSLKTQKERTAAK